MKKLLSALGAITIAASSASAVVACGTDNNKNMIITKPESQNTQDVRNSSLSSVKSFVMADQFGLNVNKTQQTVEKTNNFNDPSAQYFNGQPDTSVAKNMNTSGTIGEDNLPIENLINLINKTFKINLSDLLGININTLINTWGDLIKEIPNLINKNNINGTLEILPAIIKNLGGLFHVDLGPDTIKAIGDWISDNVEYIAKALDVNQKAADMIKTVGQNKAYSAIDNQYKTSDGKYNTTVGWFAQRGIGAFESLFNDILLRNFGNDKPSNWNTDHDTKLSRFIGEDILTPTLNEIKPNAVPVLANGSTTTEGSDVYVANIATGTDKPSSGWSSSNGQVGIPGDLTNKDTFVLNVNNSNYENTLEDGTLSTDIINKFGIYDYNSSYTANCPIKTAVFDKSKGTITFTMAQSFAPPYSYDYGRAISYSGNEIVLSKDPKITNSKNLFFDIKGINLNNTNDASKDIVFLDNLPDGITLKSASVSSNVLSINLSAPIVETKSTQSFRFSYKTPQGQVLTSKLNVAAIGGTPIVPNNPVDPGTPQSEKPFANKDINKILNDLGIGKSTGDETPAINPLPLAGWAVDIVNKIGEILTSLVMQFNIYHSWLSDDSTFKAQTVSLDDEKVTVSDDGMGIQIDSKPVDLSIDNMIRDLINNLTNTNADVNGIMKIVYVLFRDDVIDGKPVSNFLTQRLLNIIFDSTKFTNYFLSYKNSFSKLSGLINVDVDASFNLNTLVDNTADIDIASISVFSIIKPSVHLKLKNTGILSLVDPLCKIISLLVNDTKLDTSTVQNAIEGIIGTDTNRDAVFYDKNKLLSEDFSTIWELIGSSVIDDINDYAQDLIHNVWYTTDKKNSLASLLGLKPGDDGNYHINGQSIAPKDFYVANILTRVLSNFDTTQIVASSPLGTINIIDLVNKLSIDKLADVFKLLLVKNSIQDPETPNGNDSLLSQILANLNNIPQLSYYIGYVSKDDSIPNLNPKHTYVKDNSLLGYIVQMLYPETSSSLSNVVIPVSGKEYANVIDINALSEFKGNVDTISSLANMLSNALQGEDLSQWINPLYNNDNAWKISDVVNNYFSGTDSLMYESYIVTFDPNGITIPVWNQQEKKWINTTLKNYPLTKYRVWFSRTDPNSKFDIQEISRI